MNKFCLFYLGCPIWAVWADLDHEQISMATLPIGKKCTVLLENPLIHTRTSSYWTAMSSFFFLTSGQHEAGTWDPNYTPGVDFLDHDFL